MLSQSIIAVLLLASSPAVFGEKVTAPANIPECSTKCMTIKLTEAATWFGPGDLASYCTNRSLISYSVWSQKPQFLVAYNKCLMDHCKGEDLTLGRQAGAAACGTGLDALNATIPATGANNSTVNSTGHGLNTSTSLNTTIGGLNSSASTSLNGSLLSPPIGGSLTGSHNGSLNGSSLNPISSTVNSTSRFHSSSNTYWPSLCMSAGSN
ncbi:uncharacterized protein MELLADRAFT_93221 [Melampsora larici-populina 98AG31]|uniref:Secreted protein n=1 Tax=Melampsora larici-populina (strain 98AG31 / pathotype 3-4-7) TaxID=747676 RepID=F4SEP3_MELLP|nr:uncharacterized protein MELLADRAFT_93221 [Melampsora larici-populina 98AG31]EGF96883.1 hypothetical protein MELLADRAFT_93221 [Melampsora larici-populina 98AG31]